LEINLFYDYYEESIAYSLLLFANIFSIAINYDLTVIFWLASL